MFIQVDLMQVILRIFLFETDDHDVLKFLTYNLQAPDGAPTTTVPEQDRERLDREYQEYQEKLAKQKEEYVIACRLNDENECRCPHAFLSRHQVPGSQSERSKTWPRESRRVVRNGQPARAQSNFRRPEQNVRRSEGHPAQDGRDCRPPGTHPWLDVFGAVESR